MNDAAKSNRRATGPSSDEGVLAKLPPTRPQRTSRRRTAARSATAGARSARAETTTAAEDGRTVARRVRSPKTATGAARTQKETASAAGGRGEGTPPARFAKRRVGPSPQPAAARPLDATERQHAVPRQGFESESDGASGPVQPPGGVELVASAAEIVVDLARAGLSAGERLLGDIVGRLPRP
jgi:hypothetical protein